jgi:2-keto-4-pentenoate hydratase
MDPDIDQIAQRFVDAHRGGSRVEIPPTAATLKLEDAYRVQDAVFAALHARRPMAWKVGTAAPDAEPNAAPIARIFASPASVAAKGFNMIGVEVEIGFRLGRDLPGRPQPYDEQEIAAAVAETLVMIEICDTRLADWETAPAMWRLADFQLNAGLVWGRGLADARAIDFTGLHAELWIDGEKKKDLAGAHPLGDPARLLPWLARHCALRGAELRAGDLVTTGSWTGMDFVFAGSEVVARFPGLGEARVTMATPAA